MRLDSRGRLAQDALLYPSRTAASSQFANAYGYDHRRGALSSSSALNGPLKSPTKSLYKLRHPSRLPTRTSESSTMRSGLPQALHELRRRCPAAVRHSRTFDPDEAFLSDIASYRYPVCARPQQPDPSTSTRSPRRALPPTGETSHPHTHPHDRTPQQARIAPSDIT
ncbi:hypothetical protein K438DRAFT_418340 [Mycena galopus ATCC 62051]|nr:hypothetical protein K438DRAFT_418340 [Mycena galopus ATCC 62051]